MIDKPSLTAIQRMTTQNLADVMKFDGEELAVNRAVHQRIQNGSSYYQDVVAMQAQGDLDQLNKFIHQFNDPGAALSHCLNAAQVGQVALRSVGNQRVHTDLGRVLGERCPMNVLASSTKSEALKELEPFVNQAKKAFGSPPDSQAYKDYAEFFGDGAWKDVDAAGAHQRKYFGAFVALCVANGIDQPSDVLKAGLHAGSLAEVLDRNAVLNVANFMKEIGWHTFSSTGDQTNFYVGKFSVYDPSPAPKTLWS